jgi:dUTPase
MTGIKPDLTNIRVFGSKVTVRIPGQRDGKLTDNTAEGRFLAYTGPTDKNIYFIDDETHKVKDGTHAIFDEAHMTVPYENAPIAAQALQRLGYVASDIIEAPMNTTKPVEFTLIHEHSQYPTKTNEGGYTITPDVDNLKIQPGETQLLQTGININIPKGIKATIEPVYSNHQQRLSTYPGVLNTDKNQEIFVFVQNNSTIAQTINRNTIIAQLTLQRIEDTTVVMNTQHKVNTKQQHQSISIKHKTNINQKPIQLPTMTEISRRPQNARAAKIEADLHVAIDLPYNIDFTSDPYDSHCHRTIIIRGRSPTLGMKLKICPHRNRVMLQSCLPGQPAAKIPKWRSELRNAYITTVNGKDTISMNDVKKAIDEAKLNKQQELKVTFSTMTKQAIHPQLGIPQLYHDQMNIIGQHLFDIKYIDSIEPDYTRAIEVDNHTHNQIKAMKKRSKLTRGKLLKGEAGPWKEWKESEFKQWDQYKAQEMFGDPQQLPKGANLLSMIWTYLIKTDGTKKARCVCNGSPNQRGTVTMAETYASALDQTGARIFWAAAALYNFVIIGADASNAFAEAPAPKAPLYIRIDKTYKEWYQERNPDAPALADDSVLRVKRALQGHPESPRLWAILIDNIIKALNLKPCTHEPNLYYTTNYNNTGKRVVFLRQVDDFAIACEDKNTASTVINDIDSKMSIKIKELGLIDRYNGVDIQQTKHYIKVYNRTYINKIESNHPWLKHETPLSEFPVPMNPDPKYHKQLESYKPLTDIEKHALEKELGFGYRQAVGEIIYAMVTCRPDISFAIIKLSQYSVKPGAIHYEALKHLYKYLMHTKDDGIYYWREQPHPTLPAGELPVTKRDGNYDESIKQERKIHEARTLTALVDSDHASDSTHRRSVTGIHIHIAGGTVLWKTKYQDTVAQSSTEAEFIAAAEAGKYILYLRTILDEIGLQQEQATIVYEDNQGALLMAQAKQPTKRTKHIEVKHFVLQQWVEQDLIDFKRISTHDNSADAMTKATPRTLFYRHMNHIMGKLIPSYATHMQTDKKEQDATTTWHIKRVFVPQCDYKIITTLRNKGGCDSTMLT